VVDFDLHIGPFGHAPTEDLMSDNSHDQHEAHTGPVKTPKQMLMLSLASFVIPVFIIIGLVFYVTSANKPAAGSVDTEKATAARIQKIGTVEVRDANRPLKAGSEVYKAQCAACHDAGAAGAPKFADAGAWGARLGGDTRSRSLIVGWREGLALAGVILASLVPGWLGMEALVTGFVLLLAVALWAWWYAPRPAAALDTPGALEPWWRGLKQPWGHTGFRQSW
jgi:cytochrome c5